MRISFFGGMVLGLLGAAVLCISTMEMVYKYARARARASARSLSLSLSRSLTPARALDLSRG